MDKTDIANEIKLIYMHKLTRSTDSLHLSNLEYLYIDSCIKLGIKPNWNKWIGK